VGHCGVCSERGIAEETRDPTSRRHETQKQELTLSFARKPAKPRAFLNEAGLYDYAVKALGRHMRTEAEMRRLMKARVEPNERGEAVIAAVIARLKEQRYLDDQSFAETYARLRHENEKLGERRVKQDLQQKGVAKDLIAETIESRYAQTSEEALAREHLARKRLHKPGNQKETARVMRRMVAAGFSTGVIYKIFRQWDVPDEALAALENLDDPSHEE
jgi:regulatory protein